MLQQTQVARVAERFEAFIRLFPSPKSLAESPERAVLAAWQGMGYYRRAKLLRGAAIEIVAKHRGRVPRSTEALRALPGVGRYTAGAIASIVFGAREPIVDGNVARVILRVRGIEKPLRDREATERCWREAQSLVDAARDPAALNEGLMELGATVCTQLRPRCESCPIRDGCRALSDGTVDRIPAPPRGRASTRVTVNTLVVHDPKRNRVLLVQRPDIGMWSSMWETPEITLLRASGVIPARNAPAGQGGRATSGALSTRCTRGKERAVLAQLGAESEPVRVRLVGSFRHVTTHRDFRFRVFVLARAACRPSVDHARWIPRSQIASFPLSNATHRVLALAHLPSSMRSMRIMPACGVPRPSSRSSVVKIVP